MPAARMQKCDFAGERETATLAHVDDRYNYGAYCRKCKHAARLSLVKLRANLGDSFLVSKIRQRLRCERCKSRAVVITFLAPDQRGGGSVTHLFGISMRR
jgi:hypothetical protein